MTTDYNATPHVKIFQSRRVASVPTLRLNIALVLRALLLNYRWLFECAFIYTDMGIVIALNTLYIVSDSIEQDN